VKIATWNVNSLKVRLPHLLDWLTAQQPEVVCLQETKLTDDAFPVGAIEAAGYHSLFAGQKTYNGVAILSRQAADLAAVGIPGFEDDQKRLIAAEVGGVFAICAYFPNGQAVGSDKYAYKLRWIEALTRWVEAEMGQRERLVLTGDFNVAPEDRDVHDPQTWAGQVLCSDAERAAFRRLLDLGLADAFRLFDQPEKSFTWWDYRQAAFRRDLGLRIDHVLVTPALAQHCSACVVDRGPRKLERPSDHAPVIADFRISP
jgi:exodeoxyribonuclease III